MKLHNVTGRDIPDAWFQLVDLCYKQGRDYMVGEGSYAGSEFRRELDYVTVHITHPQTRPLLPEIPKQYGIPDPVPEGMDYVERYLPYLMTPAKEPGEQYTYGERLFSKQVTFEPNLQGGRPQAIVKESQVTEVIAKFRRGFTNNQACMTIAEPLDIHLPDPPCLRQIDCRIFPGSRRPEIIRSVNVDGETIEEIGNDPNYYHPPDEEQLHFFIYFRSWDLWGGFPANLAAIAHLQEYMASEIGVEPGEMVCASKGLHLYSMYWELAKIRLGETE